MPISTIFLEIFSSRKVEKIRDTTVALLILFIISTAPITAYSATYYVATTGDDSNTGSENQAWLTITKAANTIVAGDTVYIKEGTYKEVVTPKNSGSTNNYIVYAAYQSDLVTIDGIGITMPAEESGLFNLEDRSHIKISGFKVTNAGPNQNNNGIYIDNCSYITVEKNYIYNTVSSGIGVWNSNNITIDNNEVVLACNDGEQECITVAGTDLFEIKNNYIHDGGPGSNGGEGIDAKDGSSNGKIYNNRVHNMGGERTGIYLESWNKHTYNIDVYKNVSYNNGAGISLASEFGGLLENVTISNNIVFNNKSNGLEIGNWGEDGVTSRPIENIKFINNTSYNNGTGGWGGGFSIDNPDARTITVRNNIFSQNLTFQISNEANLSGNNLVVENNLINDFRGEEAGEMLGSNQVEGNPLFVNATSADFTLQANSPAIDKGSSVGVPEDDFNGSSRPQGTGYDIGAFEYGSAGPILDIKANGLGDEVTIVIGDVLSIALALSSGNNGGTDCDWWVARSGPDGWYYYNLSTLWTTSGSSYTDLSPTYQGPLFDLNSYLLSTSGLSKGIHTFYFAIDTDMNGTLDLDKLHYDSVTVKVE